MRLSHALLVIGAVVIATLAPPLQAQPLPAETGVDEPFRVMGNIYYVGGRFGSYLITTPEGHILHDTGSSDMHEGIVSNVEKLGFNVRDIRIMISSHAHWDHIGGHAAMQRVTGAKVVALGGDAVALQSGSRNFEPVTVDRVIEDGDVVTLGGVTLRALWTPGAYSRSNAVDDERAGGWEHVLCRLPRWRDSEPPRPAIRQSQVSDDHRRHAENAPEASGDGPPRPVPPQSPSAAGARVRPDPPRGPKVFYLPRRRGLDELRGGCTSHFRGEAP